MLLGAVFLVAFNLRTTPASLPPLLGEIQPDLRLSSAAAGLLTALPVLCMALCSPPAHRAAQRIGRRGDAAGRDRARRARARCARGVPGLLFAGTLLAGVGVAAAGVTLPGIVKDRFAAPARRGDRRLQRADDARRRGLTRRSRSRSATRSAPGRPHSPRWAVPASLAAASHGACSHVASSPPRGRRPPAACRGAHAAAWLLAAFMSAQSALAYAYIAWLPPAYESRGWSAASAPARCSGPCSSPSSSPRSRFPLSPSARRPPARAGRGRRVHVCSARVLAARAARLAWFATIVLGLGLGGGFTLGLVLMADLAASPRRGEPDSPR